jgi:drug/metabolite transporter (DMT)-like permease
MEKEYWFVITSGMLFGTLVFGGQIFVNLGLSLYEILIFPLIFGFLLLPLIIFKKECNLKKSMFSLFLFMGLFGAITRLSQFSAVVLGVPVAIVVLLLYTQPLWTVIFSRLLLQEKITKNKVLAIMLVLTGVVTLVNPFNPMNIGNFSGIIIALIGGISLSAWIVYSRKSAIKKYHHMTTTFGVVIFVLVFLIISYPIVYFFIRDPQIIRLSLDLPMRMWFYLFAFMVISELIPYILLLKGLKKVLASSAGIILLLEPVSAALLAAVLLHQPITPNILLGGSLILISNYIVICKK